MLQFWFIANSLLWPFSIEVAGFRVGLNVFAIVLIGMVLTVKIRLSEFSVKVIIAFFAYTLFSAIAVYLGPCTDKFEKSFITIPIFFFALIVGLEIGWRASEIDWLKLQRLCPWILLAGFGGFVAESFGLLEGKGMYESYSGIFSEPSHVALSLFPSVAILLLAQRKNLRWIGILALLGLLVFSRSSTLLMLTIAWLFYQAFMQRKLTKGVMIWAGAISVSLLVAGQISSSVLDPFIERVQGVVEGSYDTQNVSSLVYLQGWQDLWANLIRTSGLGLGFNMMGCMPLPAADAREVLARVFEIELNSEDGSFILSKLVSETGVFGISLMLVIVWWFISLIREIRKLQAPANDVILIQTGLIFMFLFISVLRGAGYFNAASLLWVAAISATVKWYRIRVAKLQSISDERR